MAPTLLDRRDDPQDKLIERIKQAQSADGLTDWEDEFLESILKQAMRGASLTELQEAKLEQIEEKEWDRDY